MQTKNCESPVCPAFTWLTAMTRMLMLPAVLAIALHPRQATAFESWEHQGMGDMAFRAAIILYGCRTAADKPVDCSASTFGARGPEMAKVFTSLLENSSQDKKKANELTYGDIDRCVDFFLTPEKLMVEASRMGGDGPFTDADAGSLAGANPAYFAALPALPSKERLPALSSTCEEKSFSPAQWAAAHVNHTHFQSELIMSASVYQMLALTMARDRHALYAALFTSAIQSHYAQDFFAPGHIVSPRAAQTDLVANATHDEYNEKGAYFKLRNSGAGKTGRTTQVLKDLLARGPSKDTDGSEKRCHDDPKGDPGTMCDEMEDAKNLLRQKIWEPILQYSPASRHGTMECGRPDMEPPGSWIRATLGSDAGPQRRFRPRSIIKDAVDQLSGKNGTSIEVKGDKLLWRNNGCDLAGLPQRLVMLAVNTLAIMDVIDAYLDGCNKSGNACEEFLRVESVQDRDAAGATASTTTTTTEDAPSPPETGFGEAVWSYSIPGKVTAGLPFGYYAFGQAPKNERDDEPKNAWNGVITYSSLLTVSGGRESFTAGSRAGRNTALLETVPFGYLPRLGPLGRVNLGLAVGVMGMQEGGVTGTGFQARVGLILPQTETTLSVWGRRTYHDGTAEHGWRNGFGLRMDQGFSSFLSVYGGIGVDYGAASGGPLLRSPMVMVGIMLGTPFSRIVRTFEAQNGPNRR